MVDGVAPTSLHNQTNDALQQAAKPQQPQKGKTNQAKGAPQHPPQLSVPITPDSSEALSGPDKERRKKVETDLEKALNKKTASGNPSENVEKELRAVEKDIDALERKLDNLEQNKSSADKARKLHEEIQNSIDSLRYRSLLLSRSALDVAVHRPEDEARMRTCQDEILKDFTPRLDKLANRLAGCK